ncbi:hypothetical protein Q9L58_010525 [Maublancomyces gigas]|uniref:Uncharacterized protein n=1 Tax=Discina gigas TaxID=1032678 RepID=A0ABR3G4G1_9PEZI
MHLTDDNAVDVYLQQTECPTPHFETLYEVYPEALLDDEQTLEDKHKVHPKANQDFFRSAQKIRRHILPPQAMLAKVNDSDREPVEEAVFSDDEIWTAEYLTSGVRRVASGALGRPQTRPSDPLSSVESPIARQQAESAMVGSRPALAKHQAPEERLLPMRQEPTDWENPNLEKRKGKLQSKDNGPGRELKRLK